MKYMKFAYETRQKRNEIQVFENGDVAKNFSLQTVIIEADCEILSSINHVDYYCGLLFFRLNREKRKRFVICGDVRRPS